MTLVVEQITSVPDLEFRSGDVRECELGGMTAAQAAVQSMGMSLSSFKVIFEGKIVAVWGYAPSNIMGTTAWVWLLSTPEVEECKHLFAAASRTVMNQLLAIYPILLVNVDPAYGKAVRWLEWLGFTKFLEHGSFIQMLVKRAE